MTERPGKPSTTDLLDAELYRVFDDLGHAERDGRGLITHPGGRMKSVDIYAHPEVIMRILRDLSLFNFTMDWDIKGERPKGPPGAIGKYRDCWLVADPEQPENAIIIRYRGNVYATIPLEPLT